MTVNIELLKKVRNHIERFFKRIKYCRRIATRYDKLAVLVDGEHP